MTLLCVKKSYNEFVILGIWNFFCNKTDYIDFQISINIMDTKFKPRYKHEQVLQISSMVEWLKDREMQRSYISFKICCTFCLTKISIVPLIHFNIALVTQSQNDIWENLTMNSSNLQILNSNFDIHLPSRHTLTHICTLTRVIVALSNYFKSVP